MSDPARLIWALLLIAAIALAERAVPGPDSDYISITQSDQILAMIEKAEPVNLSDTTVNGDLDLSKINLSKTQSIDNSLKITNSIIYGTLNFNNTIFKRQVSFEKTKFQGPCYFNNAQFNEDTDFEATLFNKLASFKRSQFKESVTFKDAHFNESADFYRSYFESEAVDFGGSQFNGPTYFWGAQFATETANFGWSQFNGPTSFWYTRFSGLAEFQGSLFNGPTDMTSIEFGGPADFLGARFNKELYFNDAKFTDFKVNWDSFRDKLVCNGHAYIQLIKNFRDLEQFEDADECYYEYRNWKRDNRPLELAKIGDYVAWLSCGYGVRWHHTIFSGIMVIVLFGLYYESYNFKKVIRSFLHKEGTKNACKYEFKENLKRAISFSAITLLSLPSEWSPFGKEEYTKFVKHHLCCTIFERMIGWGLMLLLIGTLSRLMVRY